METTYKVRIWKIDVYKGKRKSTFTVRWSVNGEEKRSPHGTLPLAEAFRSSLITAASKGEVFDVASGLPVSLLKAMKTGKSWFEFAIEYADRRWPKTSASQRKNTAQVLMMVTVALCGGFPDEFQPVRVRTALRDWAYNKDRRESAPADVVDIIEWTKRNSPSMLAWTDTEVITAALDAIGTLLNGKPAAKSSIRRDRSILHHVLRTAVERNLIAVHPFTLVQIDKVRSSRAIDKRSLLNHTQCKSMLAWIEARPRNGRCLHAFLAVIYYAGLRPEEAVVLCPADLTLPDEGWGEILAHDPAPEIGRRWTDSGKTRDERRQLKGRDCGETRPVPAHPALVRILRAWIASPSPHPSRTAKPLAPGDRLFRGEHGGDLAAIVYRRNWRAAREAVLTPEQVNSPLGQRVYVLRHVCLTTQLNSGVPPAQVAEWAGNSVAVLLSTYVNCIRGSEDELKQRILDALPDDEPAEDNK